MGLLRCLVCWVQGWTCGQLGAKVRRHPRTSRKFASPLSASPCLSAHEILHWPRLISYRGVLAGCVVSTSVRRFFGATTSMAAPCMRTHHRICSPRMTVADTLKRPSSRLLMCWSADNGVSLSRLARCGATTSLMTTRSPLPKPKPPRSM